VLRQQTLIISVTESNLQRIPEYPSSQFIRTDPTPDRKKVPEGHIFFHAAMLTRMLFVGFMKINYGLMLLRSQTNKSVNTQLELPRELNKALTWHD